LAIGAAAHGHAAGRRWWNLRTPERYLAAVGSGGSAEAGHEVLDAPARVEEALMLAIRTRRGIPVPNGAGPLVSDLALEGLVEATGDRVTLTRRGRLLASEVTTRLLSAIDRSGSRSGPRLRKAATACCLISKRPGPRPAAPTSS
jgi:oxygen-independent coproporphyrinogen-3 oxidase